MNIIYEDYILKPADHAATKFDIYQKVTRTKKDSEETYGAEVLISYGVNLNGCIETIAHLNVRKIDGRLTLKEYIEKLQEQLETIKKELQ